MTSYPKAKVEKIDQEEHEMVSEDEPLSNDLPHDLVGIQEAIKKTGKPIHIQEHCHLNKD